MHHRLLALALGLAAALLAAAQDTSSSAFPDPATAAVTYDSFTSMDELAERLRADLDVPGLAIACADASGVKAIGAAGVRVQGADDAVRHDDRFHIGSITKSVTSTVIGGLIEQGKLEWTTTVGEVLHDIEMHDAYRDVTVMDLMRHRSGIVQHESFDDESGARLVGLPGTPTAQRRAYVGEVLLETPIAKRGASMNYSNAGYAVAGLIAERVSGRSWETLVRETIFEPNAMETSGIGWPTSVDPAQPRGHFTEGDGVRPQGLDEYDLGSFIAPAGDVHCSAADLARYGRMHLLGLTGKATSLKSATIKRLHEPHEPRGKSEPYACGWVVDAHPDGTRHWHNGSGGTYFAYLAVLPEQDLVVAVVMNRLNEPADATVEKAIAAILERREAK